MEVLFYYSTPNISGYAPKHNHTSTLAPNNETPHTTDDEANSTAHTLYNSTPYISLRYCFTTTLHTYPGMQIPHPDGAHSHCYVVVLGLDMLFDNLIQIPRSYRGIVLLLHSVHIRVCRYPTPLGHGKNKPNYRTRIPYHEVLCHYCTPYISGYEDTHGAQPTPLTLTVCG